MIQKEIKHNLHYDGVRGDFLRQASSAYEWISSQELYITVSINTLWLTYLALQGQI